MNLQRPNANDVSQTSNRSRSVVPGSGLCSRCIDGCRGNCEVFQATFRGREVIYPGSVRRRHRRRRQGLPGRLLASEHPGLRPWWRRPARRRRGQPGHVHLPRRQRARPSTAGTRRSRWLAPVFTGALGSTEIARKNWEHFAVGAAITGVTLVCGENVCGIDPELELDSNGKIKLGARHGPPHRDVQAVPPRAMGEILVQMNVEDTRLGVAEYVIDKHGLDTIELKWGQGAKCIGGEIKVDSLERALELQRRGYIVTPDPSDPVSQAAFKRRGASRSSSGTAGWASSTRRVSWPSASGCASWASSGSRSRPAPTGCASWPWRSSGAARPRSTC